LVFLTSLMPCTNYPPTIAKFKQKGIKMDKKIKWQPMIGIGLLLSLTTLNAGAALTAYTSVGQSVVYSSASNLTWTGDANLLGAMQASNPNIVNTIINTVGFIPETPNAYYDTPQNSGIHLLTTADFNLSNSGGHADWFGAKAFISYLNIINYAGSNHWTLPSAGTSPQLGYNPSGSQFGELVYNELGGAPDGNIPKDANFTNEAVSAYWMNNEYVAYNSVSAWAFNTVSNYQIPAHKDTQLYVWAVTPGNITTVPVPAAGWLFGSGLLGLVSLRRKPA
jgi:hypothetical protein